MNIFKKYKLYMYILEFGEGKKELKSIFICCSLLKEMYENYSFPALL